MNKPNLSVSLLAELQAKIDQFAHDRDWGKFHTPKNLSMALAVEAAELMEIFQWQIPSEDADAVLSAKAEAIEHEVADILIYLLRFCSVCGVDIMQATEKKLKLNAEKYPIDAVRGSSAKYSGPGE